MVIACSQQDTLSNMFYDTNVYCFLLISKWKTWWEQREMIHPEARGREVNRCVWRVGCRGSLKEPYSITGERWRHTQPTLLGKYKFTVILLLLWVSGISYLPRLPPQKHWAHWEADGRWKTCLLSVPGIPGRWPSRNDDWSLQSVNYVSFTLVNFKSSGSCARVRRDRR